MLGQSYISIKSLKGQITETEDIIKKAEEEIKILNEQKSLKENPELFKEENEFLKLTHQLCQEDIKEYKEKILKLEEEVKENEKKLENIKLENEKLNKEKKVNKNINKEIDINLDDYDDDNLSEKMLKVKDILKRHGINVNIISNNDYEFNNYNKNNNNNSKNENFEIMNKKKREYSKILDEFQNRANSINFFLDYENYKYDNFKSDLYIYQNYRKKCRERLNISFINNNNKSPENNNALILDEYSKIIDQISKIISQIDNTFLNMKNNFGKNIENKLTNIQNNINNLTQNNIESTEQIIKEVKKLLEEYENKRNKCDSLYNEGDLLIRKIDGIHKKLLERHFKKLNNKQDNKNIINNNQNLTNINDKRKKLIEQSFLFNVKNVSNKLDLYKTINIFKKKEEESYEDLEDSMLLQKNYHEICYIYDDYDIYDIYYTLKAVGLPTGEYFTRDYYTFFNGYKIEIQQFFIDDKISKYTKVKDNKISFDIKLYNLDSKKIHIKFKAIKDLSDLSKEDIEERKIYRYDYYGIYKDLAGENAKFSLILKGSFDIVNFEDYFLIRNLNNKKEIEYMWGGVVPPEGKRTRIMLSKKEAIWSFTQTITFYLSSSDSKSRVCVPMKFLGGNNDFINIIPSSKNAENIFLDEKGKLYIFEYNNNKSCNEEIIIKGEFKNKCKGGWKLDITDEEVEYLMPEEDKNNKEQLKKIATEIINDFDKKNKNNDFEYLDYMKIGLWVYNNIQYDYKCISRHYTTMEIYNMRRGVCADFTQLSNALLYSLGYKMLLVHGYCIKKNGFKFDSNDLHAYSLIKLKDNKWYPFDSTWGIFTGKLHVGHIFKAFVNRKLYSIPYSKVDSYTEDLEGKFIK